MILDPIIEFDLTMEMDAQVYDLELDGTYINGGGQGEPYDGPYSVRPIVDDSIVLLTANRYLSRDVTVEQIPFYQTTNPAGGYTAIIGD